MAAKAGRPSFFQKARAGRAIFQIVDDYLDITTFHLGDRENWQVPLSSLDPAFEVRFGRLRAMAMVSVLLAAAGLRLVMYILSQERLPTMLAYYPALFTASMLGAVVYCLPRFEVIIFKNHWGQAVFTILREPGQRQECDDFLTELVTRIENPSLTLLPANSEEIEGPPVRSNWRWRASLVLGAVSVALPWLPPVMLLLEPMAFPVIFFSSTLGALFAVLSFLTKEPMRYASIPGLLMALIPPFFY